MEFKLKGSTMVRKSVGRQGVQGRVLLPKAWIGEEVAIIRLVDK